MSLIVKHEDARALGWCNRGLREAAVRKGIDWTRFIREGIPEEELVPYNDSMINQIIAQARKRVNGA